MSSSIITLPSDVLRIILRIVWQTNIHHLLCSVCRQFNTLLNDERFLIDAVIGGGLLPVTPGLLLVAQECGRLDRQQIIPIVCGRIMGVLPMQKWYRITDQAITGRDVWLFIVCHLLILKGFGAGLMEKQYVLLRQRLYGIAILIRRLDIEYANYARLVGVCGLATRLCMHNISDAERACVKVDKTWLLRANDRPCWVWRTSKMLMSPRELWHSFTNPGANPATNPDTIHMLPCWQCVSDRTRYKRVEMVVNYVTGKACSRQSIIFLISQLRHACREWNIPLALLLSKQADRDSESDTKLTLYVLKSLHWAEPEDDGICWAMEELKSCYMAKTYREVMVDSYGVERVEAALSSYTKVTSST